MIAKKFTILVFCKFRCSSGAVQKKQNSLTPKISISQLSLVVGAVGAVQVQFKKAKNSTDTEDFYISVEFGAVGAVVQ